MSENKELREKLFRNKKNAFHQMNDVQLQDCNAFADGYKAFLDASKTERESVCSAVTLLENAGFSEFKFGMPLKAGDKVYIVNRGKAVIAAVIGSEPIADGVKICAAHIDVPRLDLKQNPLYESSELAFFKTHYYGGIKKYQWTAVPLALHGVIIRADGAAVTVAIGEDEGEPVFCVTDLLPHLATEQYKRPLNEGIKGEELNILVGSYPFKDDDAAGSVKLNILNILNEKYGITEEDFVSAELEAVPAHKARDVGFDRSMVGAYGHDDRVCSYAALAAILQCENPKHTAVTVLTDKEETGSDGNTGLNSAYMRYFIEDLASSFETPVRKVLSASQCLSADVNAAFDPTFPDVLESNNCSYMGKGVVLTKYTGSRGKANTSDASAELVGTVRRLLDSEGISWQTGELGRVDIGGGGTVAMFVANLNVDVIDVGVPVLSMHSPFEIVSKTDLFMTIKAFIAFFNS